MASTLEYLGTGFVASRVRSVLPALADAEVRVARWLLEEPQRLLSLSMAQVAQEAGVSDTTVLRFCRSVGFRGFTDVKLAVAGDVARHDHLMVEGLSADDDLSSICAKVFRANAQALADTAATLDMAEFQRAVDLLAGARRVIVIGVGTSIPIVVDLHHKLFRIGLDCVAYTDSYLQLMVTALLDKQDVVVGISHSGTSIDPVLTLDKARERGCGTIAITGNGHSPFTKSADVTLLSVASELRPEALASRAAQMAIVDALYVALSMRDPERALESERRAFDSVIAKMIQAMNVDGMPLRTVRLADDMVRVGIVRRPTLSFAFATLARRSVDDCVTAIAGLRVRGPGLIAAAARYRGCRMRDGRLGVAMAGRDRPSRHGGIANGIGTFERVVEACTRKNLLRVEVTSRHVAELAAALCGSLFECTTGGQVPVDGGNERVI